MAVYYQNSLFSAKIGIFLLHHGLERLFLIINPRFLSVYHGKCMVSLWKYKCQRVIQNFGRTFGLFEQKCSKMWIFVVQSRNQCEFSNKKSWRRQTDTSYRCVLLSTWNKTDFQTWIFLWFQRGLPWLRTYRKMGLIRGLKVGFGPNWDKDGPVAGISLTSSRFFWSQTRIG